MDSATPGSSVEPAFADDTVEQRRLHLEQSRNDVLASIISHHSLYSTLQRIADAVAFCSTRAVAIFLFSNQQFHLEAEAGLPATPPASVLELLPEPSASPLRAWRKLDSPSVSRQECGWNFPALQQILDTGVQLCMASPLVSASGETRGAFAVFDRQQGLLDESTRETVRSLCDLARLAIEHDQLYDEVVRRSQFDSLTGLPNRLLLEDRLRQSMIAARRVGTRLGVCCIDLDRFKQVNDSLGHELGDFFFKLVSERLNLSIREMDTLARHGGDEFILALGDLAETSDATNICQRLLGDLSAPFLIDGRSLSITASIGISIFPDHGDTPDLLLGNASMALQAAKRAGGGTAKLYSPAFGRQTRRAAELVGALANAVAQAQFRMAYQPIYTLDKEIVAFEALLRWKHPTWGRISPLEFIPLAEKTGLIVAIGDWVIDEVCRQAMEWNAAAVHSVKMFANVSGVQLEHPDFASKIADALARSGLPTDRLELEITESWVISDLRGAAGKLQQLRDLGIGIAIDDFGTGYSTFNYLQELPLDTLKIDRSFIHRLDGSAANLSTVRAITMLAQQHGLQTVAEGVESEQQITQLGEVGCELMQGFFLTQPLNPEAACSLLRKQQRSAHLLGVAS